MNNQFVHAEKYMLGIISRLQAFVQNIFFSAAPDSLIFISKDWSVSAVPILLVFSKGVFQCLNVFLTWLIPRFFVLVHSNFFFFNRNFYETSRFNRVWFPGRGDPAGSSSSSDPMVRSHPFFYLVLSKDNIFGFLSSKRHYSYEIIFIQS